MTNIDLTAETGQSHATIDRSLRLHAMIIQKIVDVVEEDLAKTVRANKKPAQKKRAPTIRAIQWPSGCVPA